MPAPPFGNPHEPNLSFSHAQFKVAWAEKNINHFVEEVETLIRGYHQSSAVNLDPQTGRLSITGGSLPIWVPLAAGDIIFNLRSALDCCWMGMKRSINRDATKGTLPRAEDRKSVVGSLGKVSMESAFQGSDAFILDEIRPYREGRENLWTIAQVDNWNKHNMLIMAARETNSGTIHIEAEREGGGKVNFYASNNKVLGGGSMGLFNFDPDATVRYHQANTTFDIILQFREAIAERPLIPFLRGALKDTKECVDLFVSRFGKPSS